METIKTHSWEGHKCILVKDLIELIDEGCGTKEFEGHYKCRKDNLCPRCERLKARIEGK